MNETPNYNIIFQMLFQQLSALFLLGVFLVVSSKNVDIEAKETNRKIDDRQAISELNVNMISFW